MKTDRFFLHLRRLLFLILTISSSAAWATDYCASPVSSTSGGQMLNYTCRKVGSVTYEMKLEFANTTSGNINGNVWADNTGGANIQISALTPVWTNGNKTATYTFDVYSAAATPNIYVATIFTVISGVERQWNLPTDENFAATCGPTLTSPTITFDPAVVVGNTVNKTQGDAPFSMTATSDSPAAITYSSSIPGVASINATTGLVTINGAGTTVITASQVATGSFSAGSKTATLNVALLNTEPTTGPATPPARNPWDVISEYGAAYTNQTGVTFLNFGGSTIVGDVTLGDGSVVKKYTGHSYSGIQLNTAGNLNVSAMTTLHMDVWSPNFTSFRVKLEGQSGAAVELDVPGGAAQGTWNSYDIPLSPYAAAGLSTLKYIVPVTFGQNATLYIANVYFYRPATTQPPTLGAFSFTTPQNLGAPNFALTAPTSNSSGTWTYTSANTAVATIVNGSGVADVNGTFVHIVGPGSSLITATQAAAGGYGQGVASSTLTVSLNTPAPTPPARDASDVMSIYSDVYTPVPGTRNYNPGWGQSTSVAYETIGSDNLLRYSNLNYQGTDFGSSIDVSGMSYLHLDVYNTNESTLSFTIVSNNGNGERAVVLSPLVQNGWNSYDIPVSSYGSQGFTAGLTSIFQFKMHNGSGKTVYVDNMYFWKPAAALIDPTISFATTDTNVQLGDAAFTLTATSDSPGAITYSSSNTAVVSINASTGLVTINGAGDAVITANQTFTDTYNSGSATTNVHVTVPPLTTAAPTPPARNAWDVISLYSNAYATSSSPVWQNQAATTDEQLEGNDTKKMSNFLIEIVTFTPTDLTAMTTLHMDVYSEDCTGMNIWLLNNGDRNAQISLVPNQWNSIDIPMSTYLAQGLNLNGVSLLKFESLNGPGKTVWVDNIYFYRPETQLPPTLSDFSIPAKNFGDPDFALTAPTSNSAGAFTYSSGNTNIATISGNTVHIVAPGSVVITATQAADGSYGTGSITATLNIAFPAPGASPVPPPRDPERVVSMYTGTPATYTNAITAARAYWTGATTMTEVPNGDNTALRLDAFGFLGLVDATETHFSAAGMSHLHLDIYLNEPLSTTPALSRVFIFLLSNGDHLYEAANLTAGWNSLSIPLTNFPGATLSDIYGLKFEQNTSSPTQIYIDNVYFSNECYTYYADADADTFGDPATASVFCAPTPGYVLDGTDCNDSVAAINPAHAEVLYNGVDDNCDGQLDEGSQLTTQVIAAQCGATLAAINSVIQVNGVTNATKYRYRVYKLIGGVPTGAPMFAERAQPYFTLTNLSSYEYATTYRIDVEVQRNNVWLGYYGATCDVSTPAILDMGGAGAVNPSQCGSQLATISSLIYTTSLNGVTGYRFKVTNLTDPSAPNPVQIIDRNTQWFTLPMLANYNYGTTYLIEVAVKTTGAYGGYGAGCEISTPAVPMLTSCDVHLSQPTSYVYTSSMNKATSYRFEVSLVDENDLPVATQYVDRNLQYFSFSMVTGYVPGGKYQVRVAIRTAGWHSPYGEACYVYAPASARNNGTVQPEMLASVFDASVFPNPYSESFMLNLETTSEEAVQIRVYDMTGKLLDDRTFGQDQIELQQFGERFPSGVYHIVLSQGSDVKTLRVIKR